MKHEKGVEGVGFRNASNLIMNKINKLIPSPSMSSQQHKLTSMSIASSSSSSSWTGGLGSSSVISATCVSSSSWDINLNDSKQKATNKMFFLLVGTQFSTYNKCHLYKKKTLKIHFNV